MSDRMNNYEPGHKSQSAQNRPAQQANVAGQHRRISHDELTKSSRERSYSRYDNHYEAPAKRSVFDRNNAQHGRLSRASYQAQLEEQARPSTRRKRQHGAIAPEMAPPRKSYKMNSHSPASAQMAAQVHSKSSTQNNSQSNTQAGAHANSRMSQHAYQAQKQTYTSSTPHSSSDDSVNKNSQIIAPKPARSSRAQEAEDYAKRRRSSKRGRILRIVAVSLVLVLGAVATAIGLYLNDINNRLGADVTPELRAQLAQSSTHEPFYMLLLGIDRDGTRAKVWGNQQANFRTDTIIMARIDPPAKKLTLISIPRDTEVKLDGEKDTRRINAAYSIGGPAGVVKAVSKLAGVPISHYAEIDFDQFMKVVDAIGGIEVDLKVPVKDLEHAYVDLPAGKQQLDGMKALGLVRSRHAYDAYGAGDFFRAANQRMVIAAIIKKVLHQDPATMTSTISSMADSVTTDLNVGDILSLALDFHGLDVEHNVYSGLTPTHTVHDGGAALERVDQDKWDAMMERVMRGEAPYADAGDDPTAGVAGGLAASAPPANEAEPIFSGYTLVLNATDSNGLAMRYANKLIDKGFHATADSADNDQQDQTQIFYNESRSHAAGKARGVAEALHIDSQRISKNDGRYSKDYDVILVLGNDSNGDGKNK